MPKGFEFENGQTQFWLPASWTPSSGGALLGRLADGVSIHAAQAEIGGILRGMRPIAAGLGRARSRARHCRRTGQAGARRPDGCRRVRAPHRVRQRGQSAPCARLGPTTGDRNTARARRRSWPHDPPTSHRERSPGAPERRGRKPGRTWRNVPVAIACDHVRPDRPGRSASVPEGGGNRHRCVRAGVRLGHLRDHRPAVRSGASPRPLEAGSRRGSQG